MVESGSGEGAKWLDSHYSKMGAKIVSSEEAYSADLILKVRSPQAIDDKKHEVDLLKEYAILISFIYPAQNQDLIQRLIKRKATVFAMDCIPRISRAQAFDALSSMANIAGYKAVIEASNHFGRFFTGQITAAGKIPPAKVILKELIPI